MKYITYLTIYSGDKLPPFYIDSTTIDKFFNGYTGSVKSKKYKSIYQKEQREKPELFDACIINEFNTREEATECERYYQKQLDVVRSDDFFNMAIASVNGCFGMDVTNTLNPFFGKTHNLDTIKQQSNSKIGKLNPMFGAKRLEHSKAMSGELNHFFGKKHSAESAVKCGLKNRKSPVWEHECALEKIWLELDKPSLNKFMKISISLGFPSGSYKNILYQFKRKHDD